jgi:hypothetical protein
MRPNVALNPESSERKGELVVRHRLLAVVIASGVLVAQSRAANAQSTFDSPIAKKPPPNVMLLMQEDRTMGIAATCGNGCHGGGEPNWDPPPIGGCASTFCTGSFPGDIWAQGNTRLQIMRRALTGGWGWNTPVVDATNGPADARLRTDGIMDAYKVRWGVAWYDGIGVPRIAANPTTDNMLAQEAVIDFSQNFNDFYGYSQSGYANQPNLNSWETFAFTAWGPVPNADCTVGSCYMAPPYDPFNALLGGGGVNKIPWEADREAQKDYRITRALGWVKDYWDPTVNAAAYAPTINQLNGGAGPIPAYPANLWFSPPDQNCVAPAVDAAGTPQGCAVHDHEVIDLDPSNDLNQGCGDPAGCRKNFTILISDGAGQGCTNGGGSGAHDNCDIGNCIPGYKGPGDYARDIYQMKNCGCGSGAGSGSGNGCNTSYDSNQVFSIQIGDPSGANWTPADTVADCGWDGTTGGALGTTNAFNVAPGGVMSLPPILAAFGAIFSMVLAGSYTGTAPTIARSGTQYCDAAMTEKCDRMVVSDFTIQDCASAGPLRCNLGRPSTLKWVGLDATIGSPTFGQPLAASGYPARCNYPECWDMGSMLRFRFYADRQTFTGMWANGQNQWGSWATSGNAPTETNCSVYASCGAQQNPLVLSMQNPAVFPFPLANDIPFLLGKPDEPFVPTIPGGAWRGDTDSDMVDDTDDPYKLADIENSRPVIVGAPPGIGEELPLWNAFKSILINRSQADSTGRQALGGPATQFGIQTVHGVSVDSRDQVLYVGSNDGFLHAFLTAVPVDLLHNLPGSAITYAPVGVEAPDGKPPIGVQASYPFNAAMYDGQEIWAYSPTLVQGNWDNLRGGRFYTVDGTPVIEDVLFTHSSFSPPNRGGGCVPAWASSYVAGMATCTNTDWEYRTVLLECLGAGGPGCFAMDVTNPWDPHLLWERAFTAVTGKGSSTSQPQIVKLKRVIQPGNHEIPYYAAVMGGGHNEAGALGLKGTFIAVGIEDGNVYTSASCTPGVDQDCADFSGPPSCVDADNDGYVDTCYIANTAAAVYKVRIGTIGGISSGNPDLLSGGSITMAPFFSGRDGTASGNPMIRAFTRVIATADIDNNLNLFFATGNIDAPSDPNETNYLFKFRDLQPRQQPVVWTPALNTQRQVGACSAPPPGLVAVSPGSFQFAPGEKVLFDPVLVNGSVIFTSYKPDPNPCVLGQGYLYGIKYDTCQNGLASPGNTTPNETKQNLGQSLPGGVAVNYGSGGIYVADTSKTGAVQANPATPPASNQFRMQKLNWRRI